MRPLILASAVLLVLSGCAASEPTAEPTELTSAQAQSSEPTETATAESDQNVEPEESSETESGAKETESGSSSEDDRQEDEDSDETGESESSDGSERESEEFEEAAQSQSPSPSPTQTQAPEPEIVGYTLAQVAEKNSSADCWVAIDGGVYDLTMWIRSHPGGSGAITQLCGTDGTSQFLGMHGGQARPASTLDGYYIGPLR